MDTSPSLSEEPLIAVKGLTKSYGSQKALDHLSFTLRRGQILGLLGPNGAGKTTAMHCLVGLLKPSAGEIRVFGLSPLEQRHEISQRFNFSSAYVQLPSNLKVSENMMTFARIYRVKNPAAKIDVLLKLFEIDDLKNRVSGALSSGEKTRLNLAKCLLNDPELLLLDEPTASLDPEMADTVRTVLKKIQKERNIGILYTSHNMPEVEALCDHVIFIHEGKTITQGSPEDVMRDFQSKSLEQVFIRIVRRGDFVVKDAP